MIIVLVILVLIIVVVLVIYQLTKLFSITEKEINRFISPDGKVETILIEKDGGATTSFAYNIYIVPKDGKYQKGKEIFIADNIQNIRIEWIKDKLLQISFDKARIFHFSNFWQSKEVKNYMYIVEIRLKQN